MQSSDQDVTPSKPTGLASCTKAVVVHPTATAISEDDEPDTLTEAEEIDDDLEYSTSSMDTLVPVSLYSLLWIPLTNYTSIQVTILSTTTAATTVATASTPRLGVRSLPPNVQRSFSNDFVPYIITKMGCSASPWSNLDADTVQGHVNFIYSGHDYAVEHGNAFHSSVSLCVYCQTVHKISTYLQSNSCIMTFQNKIGCTVLTNV